METIQIQYFEGFGNVAVCMAGAAGDSLAKALVLNDKKPPLKDYVFLVNGHLKDASYIMQSGDIVMCRHIPHGAVAASIVIGVVALVGATVAGIQGYKAKKAAQEAQRQIDKVKKQANNLAIDNRPFLRGASNTVATGASEPYIMGRCFLTPYLLADNYYKISGEDGVTQHTYSLLQCGFAKQAIQKIGFDDVIVKTFQTGDAPYAIAQQGSFAFDANATFAGVEPTATSEFVANEPSLWSQETAGDKMQYTFLPRETVELYWHGGNRNVGPHYVKYPSAVDQGFSFSVKAVSQATYTIECQTLDVTNKYTRLHLAVNGTTIIDTKGAYNASATYTITALAGQQITVAGSFKTAEYESINTNGLKNGYTHTVAFNAHFIVRLGFAQRAGDTSCLAISQDGSLFTGALSDINYKHTSTACNQEIPKQADILAGNKTPYTFTLDPQALDVEVAITFPYGLYYMTGSGGVDNETATIHLQYSVSGGQYWSGDLPFDINGTQGNTFTRAVNNKEIRFVAKHTFTHHDLANLKNNRQQSITCRLTNEGSNASQHNCTCYCLYYQSVCYDRAKSPTPYGTSTTARAPVPCLCLEDKERAVSCLLALKVKSNDSNQEKLKKINIITQGLVARTWDIEDARWRDTPTPSRNPAAWALEVLTSPTHPLSRFDLSEINLPSFGEFFEYCDGMGTRLRMQFDLCVTQNQKKQDLLQKILDATGAMLYKNQEGLLCIAIDNKKHNATALFNAQNLISLDHKKEYTQTADAYRIKFINSLGDLFKEDTMIVYKKDYTPTDDTEHDFVIKDLSVDGITTQEHIVWYARRLLAQEILRPTTATLQIGTEGVFLNPFDKVLLQDSSLKNGFYNSTIKDISIAGDTVTLTLKDAITLDPASNYSILLHGTKGNVVQGAISIP